jgi:pyrimidine 5'-nucleotidase
MAVANKDVVGVQEETPSAPRFETLVFDLDDTLYPLSSGLAHACRLNIESYMVEKMGIDPAKVPDICSTLYKSHGTTMAGLWAEGYYFDHDDFHKYVHGRLPYHLLRPDPILRNLLQSMPQPKYIFTNADKIHAAVVLKKLGVEDMFEGILCFETFNTHCAIAKERREAGEQDVKLDVSVPIVCKPSIACMGEAVQLLGINPAKTLYFDDSARNIFGGKSVGLHTVLVGSPIACDGADHHVSSIHNVRESIPEIWAEPHFFDELRLSRKIAVETVA